MKHSRLFVALIIVLITYFVTNSSLTFAYLTDGAIYSPPDYLTFSAPPVGGSYTDPVFGTAIKRLSDAMHTPDVARGGMVTTIENEYSTMSPFNSDSTRLLIQHFSYFSLYDGAGNFIRDLVQYGISASVEPRWSRTDPYVFYYVTGNQLRSFNVGTLTSSLVRAFTEYTSVRGEGEADISFQGNSLVLAGDRRYIFVYDISTDTKGPAFDAGTNAFDNMYITPDNNVLVGWYANGSNRFNGIEMFDKNMNFLRQIAHAMGHMDVTRDTTGEEVAVWTNAADSQLQVPCVAGVTKIRLSDGKQTCVFKGNWNLAYHISAPDNSGWFFMETYAPADPIPPTGWNPYTDEILQVKLDGSEIRRLAHHRSRPFNSYTYTPRVSTNRQGTKLVYSSNYGLQSTLGYPANYSDAYMIDVPAAPPAATTITWSSPADITYGAALGSAQLNATAGANGSSVAGTFTYTPASGTVLNAGAGQTLHVDFTPTDSVSYSVSSKDVTINVSKASQAITFAPLVNKAYGDAPFNVNATASSNLPVNFSASGSCTVSTSTVTITGAGSCTITASQAGNSNYNAAADVSQSFTIANAASVITWSNPADISYGTALGTTQLNATASVNGSSVAGTFVYTPAAGTALNAGVGQTLHVDFNPADTTNYSASSKNVTINVTKASQTITFGPLVNKKYGDPPFTVSATASSNLAISFSASGSCTVSNNTVTITAAGSCTVTAGQAGNSNYDAAPDVAQSFTITSLTSASDSFDRADGALGSNWSALGGGSLLPVIRSGRAGTDSPYTSNRTARYSGIAWGNNQSSQITFPSLPLTVGMAAVRMQSNANAYYAGGFDNNNFNNSLGTFRCRIVKYAGYVVTSLALDNNCVIGVGATLKLEVQGTTLRLYVNGVLKLTASDSSYGTGGPGFTFNYNQTNASIADNWVGATLP